LVVKGRWWSASALHKRIVDSFPGFSETGIQLFRDIAALTCPRGAACAKIGWRTARANGLRPWTRSIGAAKTKYSRKRLGGA
jgi:hypothetical protein